MIIGLVSRYGEGWLDLGLQPVMVARMATPGLVLALAIVSVLKSRTMSGMLTIAVVIIPGNSHVVRGAVPSAKQNPYVEAAQVLGCRRLRIIASHILPDVTATVLITADRGVMAGCRLQSGEVAEWAAEILTDV
jgi:peptide/nickel transport system permease protein